MKQCRHSLTADITTLRRLFSGLAAGDALGSTTEFMMQRDVPDCYQRLKAQGWPFCQAGNPSRGLAAGHPTDDTEMALCIIRSYFQMGGFDACAIASEFVSWMKSGPRDMGSTTKKTLLICEQSSRFWEGGRSFWEQSPHYAANGSLMRNGIVAGLSGYGSGSLERAFDSTLKHGMITHYAPLPQICCLAQTYLIQELLKGRRFEEQWLQDCKGVLEGYLEVTDDSDVLGWIKQVEEQEDFGRAMSLFCREMKETEPMSAAGFDPFKKDYTRGSGYCMLTLKIALWGLYWSLEERDYAAPHGFPEEVFAARGSFRLAWVAMIGHDADTYAAVAGPLIAAASGDLPAGFTDGLKALEEFDKIASQSQWRVSRE